MSYGLEILDGGGVVILGVSSRTARLVNVQNVTVSNASGTNTDYTIPSDCNAGNAFVVLDNQGGCAIVAAGVARVYGGNYAFGATVMRTYKYK